MFGESNTANYGPAGGVEVEGNAPEGTGQEGAPEGDGGGAPEGGGTGDGEKRGGRIYRHKYATDGFVENDLLAKKQQDMDPRQYLLFGNTDTSLPPAGLPIGQAVGKKAVVDTAKGVLDASKLTQEALEGRLPPDYFQSDEGIGRALGAAGMGMAGGLAGAPARAGETVLGSGPVRKAMDIVNQPAYERQLSPLGFYSHGAETAANLPQVKGTPQQYRAMLERGGVKPVELEGFEEAFAGRPSVTREEIAAHFKERMPQIEETVLGIDAKPPITEERYRELARTWEQRQLTPEEMQEFKSYERYVNGERPAGSPEFSPTKFSQYTLPGGENYREVLLRLGEKENPKADAIYKQMAPYYTIPNGTMTPEFKALKAEYNSLTAKSDFKDPHWPDDTNVIAHLRFSDRVGPNGEKILHMEEAQSGWGQQGRKEGFRSPKGLDPDLDVWANSASKISSEEYDNLIDRLRKRYNVADANEENNIYANAIDQQTSGIPHAPYVTNTQAWTDLALKRALREAAEGGYDKLVWTPGAEQAKRYDLSKQVGKIYYDPELAGGTLAAEGLRPGQTILDKPNIKPENIADYIGKEAAEKLLSQPRDPNGMHILEGNGLSMGGEGMKGYYDKIVPNQLSKLVKKLDPEAKIGRETFGVGKYEVVQPNGTVMYAYPDRAYAHRMAERWDGTVRQNQMELPSLTITPKMREAIMKGLPAHKRGGKVNLNDTFVSKALRVSSKFGSDAAKRSVQQAKRHGGRTGNPS